MVDGDHNTTNGYGNTRAGNAPRKRVKGGGRSAREAVPGLPENFYDEAWLASLSNRDKRDLRVLKPLAFDALEDE
jgi:hypothetical protein